jgi:beta-glucuronidase
MLTGILSASLVCGILPDIRLRQRKTIKFCKGLNLKHRSPGSINEQLAERGYRDFTGPAWLQYEFEVPKHFANKRLFLRFGSLDLSASVYLNGQLLGHHSQPYLPALFDVSKHVLENDMQRITICLDGKLPQNHPLPGISVENYSDEGRPRDEVFPPVRYDFFPFIGVHRSPQLLAVPHDAMQAVWCEGDLRADGTAFLRLGGLPASPSKVRISVFDKTSQLLKEQLIDVDADGCAEIPVANAKLWSCKTPNLYQVKISRFENDIEIDCYTQAAGFRHVNVEGKRLLLNGEPIQFKGFGMHEDFPVLGKAHNDAVAVKSFEMLRWLGANSFRTSHYPYAEEVLDMADARGVLVISELASVNLDFRKVDQTTITQHCQSVQEQIQRDRGHASVIAWSLTNEPGYLSEKEYLQHSSAYFSELFSFARRCDPHRPLTAANIDRHGLDDPILALSDFISINRYYGWYSMPAQLDRAEKTLRDELNQLELCFAKPILITEFGADAVAGMHATSDQLFTEEFQAHFIETYWRVISEHPACIGGHVWNFADFRTAQHHRRVVMNHKGVFTRVRDPKMAAWVLKRLWSS